MSEINDTTERSEGTFPINLKLIKQHQHKDFNLMDKYKEVTYQAVTFSGVSNIYLNHKTCKDKIVIPPILQSYILHWYHTYIIHPVMVRTEVTILQQLYWPGIIYAAQKEVTNFNTCQCTKLPNRNMLNYQQRKLRIYHVINPVYI